MEGPLAAGPSQPDAAVEPEARARELLRRVAAVDGEAAWELGLCLQSLAESCRELAVRVGALEEDNRHLQERLQRGHQEYAQLRASMDELLNLHELSEAISTSLNVEDVLQALMRLSARVVDYDSAGVFSLRRGDGGLEPMVLRGRGEVLRQRVRTQWEDGIIDWVLRERRPVVIDDLESPGGQTFVLIPLLVRGQEMGLFILHCGKAKDDFTLGEIELLGVLANQTAAAIENSRLYTDLETAHQRLKESQRQLLISAKQAAIGELAGGVAHEVNNPLQIILSRVQLMLAQQARLEGADARVADGLRLIENNVRRISRIIRALLGYATHTVETEGQVFAVGPAIHQAWALTKHQLDARMIDVTVRLDDDLPELFGNVGELEQVFINLILNAENAMADGGHLDIAASRRGDGVEIRFRDTGHGIAPEHMDRIFEPFFTTRADRGGTGLGLAVSYRIVENHGGTITVESAPGQGACFIIRLPLPGSANGGATGGQGEETRG